MVSPASPLPADRKGAENAQNVDGVVTVTDVSSQHTLEEALRDSEERWKFALAASGEGVWDWNVETGEVFCSDRWYEITGVQRQPQPMSEWTERIHPDDRQRVTGEIRRFFRAETGHFQAEYRLRGPAMSYLWVMDRAKIVGWTPTGKPRRVVGTIADITPRKHAEDELARTNEFLAEILESSSTISIISTDRDGVIEFWNSGAESVFGYRAEEVVGKQRMLDLSRPGSDAETEEIRTLRDCVMQRKETVSRVVREVRKDGSTLWVKLTVSPRVDRQGIVRGMLGIGENLTSQVEAEAGKEQRERELRLLAFTLNCTKDGICITDLGYRILYANESLRLMYGYDEDELTGKDVRELQAGSVTYEQRKAIDVQTKKGGWSGALRSRRKDGSEFPAEVSTSLVRNDLGEPVAFVAVARDITERMQTDEQIRGSLREKEVMLKEIHHRVKNNLQVISSLLNLQSAASEGNPAILAALKESQGRVRSMALVHEELYRSRNLGDIDMASYVRKLTSNLFFAYQSATTRVMLDIDVRDVYLPIDTAIPCGLIINELISNSLKYAFLKRQKGVVTVRFSQEAEVYRLIVSDDGVGLPKDLDIEHTESLGLQLVSTLAKQLRGSISVTRARGTAFTLAFSLQGKPANG